MEKTRSAARRRGFAISRWQQHWELGISVSLSVSVASICTQNFMLTLLADTAWTKRPATEVERMGIWRHIKRELYHHEGNPWGDASVEAHRNNADLKDALIKFATLQPVFWVRFSDFLDIVPRFPHLNDIDFEKKSRPIPKMYTGLGNGDETLTFAYAIRNAPPHQMTAVSDTSLKGGDLASSGTVLTNGYH
jgi:hypothetical protein